MSDAVVAYHEAGHAVACVLLGRNLSRIVLDRERRSFFEVEEWPPTTRQAIEDEIVSFYAGPAAQRIFTGRPVRVAATIAVTIRGGRKAITGTDSDGSQILALAARALGPSASSQEIAALRRQLDTRARELITGAWAAVELVARELLARRELSGDEVRELVRQAVPGEEGGA